MGDATPAEPLDPNAAARLADFARSCAAAARAVSLHPTAHPSVNAALTQLTETARTLTAAAPIRLTVLPDRLLLDGRAPGPNAAAAELARLFHQHQIVNVDVNDSGSQTTWLTLLSLLARPPEENREAGGIAHLWGHHGDVTSAEQRRSIVLREVDYEQLLGRHSLGDPATLEQIFDSLWSGHTDGLDAEAWSSLSAIIRDPARLALFAPKLEEWVAEAEGVHAESVLHLLRAATELLKSAEDAPPAQAFGNLASLLSGLSAETLADLLRQRDTPAAQVGEQDAVQAVTSQMPPDDVAAFVSNSIVAEGGASARLAEAFQALVADRDEQRQLLSLVEGRLADSPFGQTEPFPDIWERAQTLLTSYSDAQYVHDEYARELNLARTQAIGVRELNDDPPERIAGWQATVDDRALRDLDLQLMLDLLTLERDPHRWRDMCDTASALVEKLAQSGDLGPTLTLIEAVARERADDGTPVSADTVAGFATAAVERLALGSVVRHAIAHMAGDDDTAITQVKRLCRTLGPGIVTSLSAVLATERDARVRRTVRDILVDFGAPGRDAVRQLLHAPDWEARQTAAVLLKELGGIEGLDELKQLLADAEPLVQREAIRALVELGGERSYQAMATVLTASTRAQRASLLHQLTVQRDEQLVPLCRYLLTQFDHRRFTDVNVAVMETLGAVGGDDAIEPLREVLFRSEWWAPARTRKLRDTAARALRRTRQPAAMQVLQEAAQQGPRGVRAAARAQLARVDRG